MNAFDLLNSLTPERWASFYFLYGPERFFVTEIIGRLTALLTTPENREFNLETLNASGTRPADWIQSARTLSFFGGTKLVVVRDIEEAEWNEAGQTQLLEYAENPLPEACLVLTAQKVDRKRKLYKQLCALPGAVSCETPHEKALAPWLRQRAKECGYTLSAAAAERLVERVGPKPGRLATELDKVMTFTGPAGNIREQEIAALVGEMRPESGFALTEALRMQNAERALALLRNLLSHGEEPLKLIGALAWQLRLIWQVKYHQGRRLPAARIAALMKQKPFVVEKAMQVSPKFSLDRLRAGLRALAWADRELKTTGKDPQGVMETLMLRLCTGAEGLDAPRQT